MGKIFCVMGKSASGKDTIYNKILQDDSLMLSRIIPSVNFNILRFCYFCQK